MLLMQNDTVSALSMLHARHYTYLGAGGCLPAKTMQLSSCRTADMISLVLPSVKAGTSSQIRYTPGQPCWYLNVPSSSYCLFVAMHSSMYKVVCGQENVAE